jgi:carbonic anhydrase/acetyltransferase-like protein (isoleucine patch superfamily)
MRLRSRRVRTLVAAAAVVLPAAGRRWAHVALLGHEVAATARIGRSLVDVDHLVMAPGASIAHLTVIRGCEEVVLEEDAAVGPLNWVNGVRRDKPYFTDQPDRRPALVLRQASMTGTLHLIDCCDAVELGRFSGLAGFGSQILTHSVDIIRVKQVARPVHIGAYSMVSTGSVVLAGAVVPDRAIVSAGSVVKGVLPDSDALYEGVPATQVRGLRPELGFFHRTVADIK